MALCRWTMQGTMSQTRVLIPPRHVGNWSRFLFNAIDRIDRSIFSSLYIFFFFFLITAGLIATRLVNRVSFVRSACSFFLSFFLFRSSLFRVYSFTAIQQRLVSHQFSNCFQSIDLVDLFIAKRCVARSFKTERFIKCLSLFLFFIFRSPWVATVW